MIISPTKVRLDVSTICQLKCPACPTGGGVLPDIIGSGFLKFDRFCEFIEQNPQVQRIEISNWGEILLNPELERMLEFAHDRRVQVLVQNGVNLNNARVEALEALVKFKVEEVSVSIDGATQDVYELYRVGGNLEAVLNNIDAINTFKRQYSSDVPRLIWQFVVFGHNEHQIETARRMAQERGMIFRPKLNFDDLFDQPVSPVRDKEYVRTVFGGVATRQEHLEKYKRPFIPHCEMLWDDVAINFNGEVLGCCVNAWGSFGNAFESSFDEVFYGEKMTYARELLSGKTAERNDVDIPCTNCQVYEQRKEYAAWIQR